MSDPARGEAAPAGATAQQPPGAMAHPVGLRVAGFVLERALGAGAMGQVYLAHQTSLDRRVALKLLPAELAKDAEFVLRFHREAKAAALLQHPNVVAVIDQGHDPRAACHYIAFELVEGGSLEDRLKAGGGRLSEGEALQAARGVLSALAFAESRGLVHRDVKPDNILFDAHGTPKLADLGLAKRPLEDSVSITKTGFVLGTPLYMAPEQALGEKDLDIRADLYALGLVLWRCLTGLTPFDEDRTATSLVVLSRHVNQDLPDPRERAPEVGEGTSRVVRWLAAREREARYRSAAQALKDVERLLRGQTPEGPAGTVTASAAAAAAPASAPAGGAARRTSSRRVAPTVPVAPPPAAAGPPRALVAVVVLAALGLGVGLAIGALGKRRRSPPPVATTDAPPPVPPTEAPPPVATSDAPPPRPPVPPRVTEAPPTSDVRPPTSDVRPPTSDVRPPPADVPPPPADVRPLPADAPPRSDPALLGPIGALADAIEDTPDQARARLDALPPTSAPERLPDDREALARLRRAATPLVAALTASAAKEQGAALTAARQAVEAVAALPAPGPASGEALQAVAHIVAEWAQGLRLAAAAREVLAERTLAGQGAGLRRLRELGAPDAVGPFVAAAGSAALLDRWRSAQEADRRDKLEGGVRLRLERLAPTGPGRALGPSVTELQAVLARLTAGESEPRAHAGAALSRGLDLGPYLAARVQALPTSRTGDALPAARALLVVPAGPGPLDGKLVLRVRDVEVVVVGDAVRTPAGKAAGRLSWARRPALLAEVLPRRLSLWPLDAETGAASGPAVEVELPRLDAAGEGRFTVRTDVGLAALALVLPAQPGLEPEAGPAILLQFGLQELGEAFRERGRRRPGRRGEPPPPEGPR